ncbi:hypothetical protein Tco_0411375 [Tanacetum coccineum]
MLHPSIRSRLVETQTIVSGFAGEQVKPLGKIDLDVCFGGSRLCRRAIMKFTIILAPSPYNIILGCSGLKQLRAIPSTIHGMMKRTGKKQAIEPPKEVELKGLSPEGSAQLKNLLKKNKDKFAWEPSDMTGMAEEDEDKTTFYTDQGTYCYIKMPFGLKNAGAMY